MYYNIRMNNKLQPISLFLEVKSLINIINIF